MPLEALVGDATVNEVGYEWPDGHVLAVSLTFDVDGDAAWLGEGEHYRRRLTSMSEGRYGIVRGLPRILELLHRHEIPGTFFVPGLTAEWHPHVVPQVLQAGHEVGHHGFKHLRSDTADLRDQREEVERGLAALARAGAPRPTGYRSPSWEITPETFDLLREYEFAYDSSCMGDDRPYVERWESGSILELPVHWSLDDWPRFGWSVDSGGNLADPGELLSSWTQEYRNAREERRHLVLTMHPEVIGRAYRLAALETLIRLMRDDGGVWFATLDQVASHVAPHFAQQLRDD